MSAVSSTSIAILLRIGWVHAYSGNPWLYIAITNTSGVNKVVDMESKY